MSLPPFLRAWYPNLVEHTTVNGWLRFVFGFPNGCGVMVLAASKGWSVALVVGKDKRGGWQLAYPEHGLTEQHVDRFIQLAHDFAAPPADVAKAPA